LEYVAERRPPSVAAWVKPDIYERIRAAASESEDGRLKPIFERLNGEAPYEQIRVVLAHMTSSATGGVTRSQAEP
jgi:hypothetical protein